MTAWWKVTGGKHWVLAGALAAGSVSLTPVVADGPRIDRDDPAREVIEELLGADRSALIAARADDQAAPKVALGKDAKPTAKPAESKPAAKVDPKPAELKAPGKVADLKAKPADPPAKPVPAKVDSPPAAKQPSADPTAKPTNPASPPKSADAKPAPSAPTPKGDQPKSEVTKPGETAKGDASKPMAKDAPRLNDAPPAPAPKPSANPGAVPPPPVPVETKEGAMPVAANASAPAKDVGAVLDGLIDRDPTRRPMPPAKGAPTRRPGPADRIIDEAARGDSGRRENPAEARTLFEQARQAEKDGKLADAARLAGAARKLAPADAAIASYADTVNRAAQAVKAKRSTNLRARAHLAAALTRGQELVQERRYEEAADILAGVVEGAALFPATDDVGMFVRLARNELANPKLAGLDAKAAGSAAAVIRNPIDDVKLVDPGYAPPENARRLLRASESAVPSWYSIQKVKLITSMSVDYSRTSMARVLDDISSKTGVQFVIDTPVAMTRAHQNTFVDLRAGDVPAETLLNLLCVRAGVEYVIMERTVVITTPARALAAIKEMPGVLRQNWAASRVLFPELDPDLVAVRPRPASMPGTGSFTRPRSEENLPPWLANRPALVEHLRQLLR